MYKYYAATCAAASLPGALDAQHSDATIEQLYVFPLDDTGSTWIMVYRQKQV